MAGPLMTVAREISKYKLHLVGLQDFRWKVLRVAAQVAASQEGFNSMKLKSVS
jgi:hypothetical protein